MANETLTDVFSDIADAVRAKGVTGQMTPLQMPAKITSIPSGGSGDPLYEVDGQGVVQKTTGVNVNWFNDAMSIPRDGLRDAYQNRTQIVSASFPNLTTIGDGGMYNCFSKCSNLSSVSFPKLQYLTGNGSQLRSAFAQTALTSIEFPLLQNATSYYGSDLAYICSTCTSLVSVSFPELTSLRISGMDYAFENCTSLKQVYLPKLSSTNSNSLSYCFNGCTSLELVDFHQATAVPAIATNTFSNTNNTFQIVVPNSLYSQWKTATNWSARADQIVMANPSVSFKATQANSTIQLTKVGNPTSVSLEYLTTGTWTPYTIGDTITLANVGDEVYFRAASGANNKFGTDANNYHQFVMTGEIEMDGSITYLLNQNGTDSTLADNSYLFYKLFSGCSALTKAPKLPEATMDEACYAYMFQGTSIEDMPKMPVATLDVDCYKGMFQDNTALTIATLGDTMLANGCYDAMFKGCSSLAEITIAYLGNFSTTYFNDWVDGVASTGTFYYYGSDTTTGSSAIPTGWTVPSEYGGLTITAREANSTVKMIKDSSAPDVNLEYSTNMATWNPFVVGTTTVTLNNIGDKVCFRAGPNGNTSFTTIYSNYSNKFVITGSVDLSGNLNSIFSRDYDNVTTINADGNGGIGNLFTDCTAIVDASKLLMKATTIGSFTYNHTFYRCTNMTKAPTIYATTIGDRYSLGDIFNGCSSLSEIKIYYTGNFGGEKTSNWVNGVPGTGTFYYNGSDTTRGASYIPTGWTITPFTP